MSVELLPYQMCVYCVMDTSDPMIKFNEFGRCNHCLNFEKLRGSVWFPDEADDSRLQTMIDEVKRNGVNNEYDCVIGLSGGIDSSYLALKAFEWNLKPLLVHVDAGWNSELAVQNIEKIVKHCGFELHTHVVDWEDVRALQLAYLRSSVSNQDVPQDHAFFAALYRFAIKNKVRYVLNGGNVATEGIFPTAWHHAALDSINIRAINSKFGDRKLRSYPLVSFSQYYFTYPTLRRMTPIRPLNLMPYTKEQAIMELEKIGWKPYPRKHGESVFTRFFQNYYLPEKFGYDKRRPHLSSLIMSGLISRENALEQLQEPLYDESELRRDKDYVCRKLRISESEFDALMSLPNRPASDYRNWDRRYLIMKSLQRKLERVTGRSTSKYAF